MKYITLFTMLTLFFNGCAEKRLVMEQQQLHELKGKTITAVVQSLPIHPTVNTPEKALGAGIGGIFGAILFTAGSDRANKLTIPANYIATEVSSFIADKYKMQLKKEIIKKDEKVGLEVLDPEKDIPEFDQLKSNYSSDYLLDISTYKWMITYTKWNGGSYVVIVKNNLRLIERESQKVISSISCEYVPKNQENLPSYNEMFANNGKIIRDESRKASDLCIEKIKKELFN